MLSTKLYRHGIALALAALLMNLALSLFSVYEIQRTIPFTVAIADTAELSDSSAAEKVLVCTAEGLRWISVADLIENPPSSNHSYYNCAFDCLSSCDAKLSFTVSSTLYPDQYSVAYVTEWTHVVSHRQHIYARGILTRAPPVFA